MKRTIKMNLMSLMGLLAMGLLASCKQEKDYTETAFGINMEMVYVKGGEFDMGYTQEQGWDWPDSTDGKWCRKTKLDGYYIGKYEVTQAQWMAVMGTTLAEQRDKVDSAWSLYGEGDDYPMYYVSWDEAREFCERLSKKTGRKYVLPTEAQWEYTARGGVHKTQTRFAGSNDIKEVAWYYENSYALGSEHPDYGTHPVGTKKANALGIYDMSGNVAEWCSDWYCYDGYDKNDNYNPQGIGIGSHRVNRGGSWGDDTVFCQVACQYLLKPDQRVNYLGFRVVCLL